MTDKTEQSDLIARAAARVQIAGWDADEDDPSGPVPAKTAARDPDPTPPPSAQPNVPPTQSEPAASVQQSAQIGAQVEIDFVNLQKQGYLTPQNQGARIAEEFRLVKRPLLRVASDSRGAENGVGHVIMVTSAQPGEGKTFMSINLAISMASEHDLFVLLIDADIRRMGLSRRLGLVDRPGIMDVLLNPDIPVPKVMARTNVPNLAVIPAGKAVEGATELFASQRMTKLVHDIASRYKDRIIIFDAPPVLAATEPSVLASHVGQIVFVVHSGETPKRAIVDSLKLIDVCPHVNFALNQANQTAGGDRFGYYDYAPTSANV